MNKIIDSIYKQRLKRVKKKKKERDLKKPLEYQQFIRWTAMPSILREPKTQQDLSKEFNIAQKTLSLWKKRENFWSDVRKEMKTYFKDKTPNVLQATYQKLLKGDASGGELKVWLQYVDEWIEKIENLNRDITLEDLLRQDDDQNEQTTHRGSSLDTKQAGAKSKVQAESDTKPIRKEKDQPGHNTEGEAKGV